jgi:hypothetical protein
MLFLVNGNKEGTIKKKIMDIRRTLNIKQFLVPNRIWIHLWVILCLALCSSCHKEDPGAYKLTADSFTNAVLSEQYYQQLLDTELSLVTSDPRFIPLAKNRKDRSAQYILELRSLNNSSDIDPGIISKKNRESLLQLEKLSGNNYRAALVEMAIESDQQLIGLHVKATTSQGLKDPVLREWAKQKLPLLTENLAGIQLLK